MPDGATEFPIVRGSESEITNLGESIVNIGEALLSTQIAEAGAANLPSSWTGQASDAYVSQMIAYQGQLIALSEEFAPVQQAINSYGSLFTTTNARIVELQEGWDTAISTFDTNKQNPDGRTSELTQAEYDTELEGLEQTRDLRLSELTESYNRALEDLNEEAQTQANNILAHLDSLVSPEARGEGRSGIAKELFNDIPLLDGVNEFNYYTEHAEDAAEFLSEPLTLERIDEFNELYGDMMYNPYFANQLIEKVGITELANILPQLDDFAELGSGSDDFDGDGYPDPFDPTGLEQMATSLGSVLILGTGGTNLGEPETALSWDAISGGLVFEDGDSLAAEQQKNREELMEYGTTVLNAPADAENDPEWDPYYGRYGYDYVITAMGAATAYHPGLTAGEEFLLGTGQPGTSMAQHILEWESNYGGARLEDPTRGPWAGDNNTTLYGGTCEEFGFSNPGQLLANLINGIDYDQSQPYADAINALDQERAATVRTFLAGDTEFLGDGVDMNMAKYMTGHRAYGWEWGDGGEIWSEVILDASDPRLDEAPVDPGPNASAAEIEAFENAKEAWIEGNRQAGVVALGFAEGYQDGLTGSSVLEGDLGFAVRNGEEDFGNRNAGIRAAAGSILAPYVDDIGESMMQRYGVSNVVESRDWTAGYTIQLHDGYIEDFLSEESIFRDMSRDEPESGPSSIDVFSEAVYNNLSADLEETFANGGTLDDIAATAARHVPILYTTEMAETFTEVEAAKARDIRMNAIEEVATMGRGKFLDLPGPLGDATDELIKMLIPDGFEENMTPEVQARQEQLLQTFHNEIYAAAWNTWDESSWREELTGIQNVEFRDPIEHFIYAEENGAFPGQENYYQTFLDENGDMKDWYKLDAEQRETFTDFLEYYGYVGESPILNSGDEGGSQEWQPYDQRQDGQANPPVHAPAGEEDVEQDDEVLPDPYSNQNEPTDGD